MNSGAKTMMGGAVEIVDAREDAEAAETAQRWIHEEWGFRIETAEEGRRWFQETCLSHDAPRPVCLVARLEGRVAGTASLLDDDLLGPPYDAASGATPWLAAVYTAPWARGRGVASALINEVLIRAKKDGAGRIWLQTDAAQDLYARFGFQAVGAAQSAESGGEVTVMRLALSE